jgi:hypothetical protein
MNPITFDIASLAGTVFPHASGPNTKQGVMVTQCCVCQRIKEGERWIHLGRGPQFQFSHGYCPECHEDVLAQVGRWKESVLRKSPLGRQ